MEKVFNKKIIKTVAIVLLIMSILPILWLAIYSRPCVDDYSYSADTFHLVRSGNYNIFSLLKEAFKVDIHFYKTWQGLYTSAFILALQPAIFGESHYFIGMWLLVVLMFASLFFFIKTILEDLLKIKGYTLITSLGLLSIILMGIPSPVEGLYWFNGAWNYTPFFFLILINISLIIRSTILEKHNNIIFSIILSLIISGGNHVTAFLNILILIILNIFLFKKSKLGILPLIFAILGFIIVMIAPGTQVRQAYFERIGIVETLVKSLGEYFNLIKESITFQTLFIALILIISSYAIYENKIIDEKYIKINPIIFYLLKVMIICGMLCVPYKAMGNFGAGRVKNVIWFTMLILNIVFYSYLLIWICYRMNKNIKFFINHNTAIYYLAIIFIFGAIFWGGSNFYKVCNDIKSGNAKKYAQACDERYILMENSNDEIIKVEKLPENELLRMDDITNDIEDWRNKVWEDYYEKIVINNE